MSISHHTVYQYYEVSTGLGFGKNLANFGISCGRFSSLINVEMQDRVSCDKLKNYVEMSDSGYNTHHKIPTLQVLSVGMFLFE